MTSVVTRSWNRSKLCLYGPDTILAIAPPPCCGAMKVGRLVPAARGGIATGAVGIAIFSAAVALQTLERIMIIGEMPNLANKVGNLFQVCQLSYVVDVHSR
jgi:hypothetical protein